MQHQADVYPDNVVESPGVKQSDQQWAHVVNRPEVMAQVNPQVMPQLLP